MCVCNRIGMIYANRFFKIQNSIVMQFSCSKLYLLLLLLPSAFFLFSASKAEAKNCNFSFYYNDTLLNDTTMSTVSDTDKKTYLALGDSYTIGQSVDSADRYPAQAAAIVRRRGYNLSSIDYIATSGWKTVNLQWAIEGWHTNKTYDVVTLLIGANDQYLKHDTIDYREHFTNLLEKAIWFANNDNTHVFVLSIPDYGVTPFGSNLKNVSRQIDEFNAINKEVSKSYNVNYTNITGISRYDAIDSTTIAWDDMHPSGKQYGQWALTLANKMLTVLQ